MARYMEVAGDLAKEVESLLAEIGVCDEKTGVITAKIGHIINLAIRACPRGVQHTVRLNIVKEAVGKYCRVTMTEEVDERTGKTYNKIHITPRS